MGRGNQNDGVHMAKRERIEDLGRVSLLIEEIFNTADIDPMNLDTFIDTYQNDPDRLEELYNLLSRLRLKLERIYDIAHGDTE